MSERKSITIWNVTCGQVRSMSLGLLGIFNPIFILTLLPKKYQEKYIDFVWDRKKDHEIRSAFFDAAEWIEISYGSFINCETTDRIAAGCIIKLRDTVWPQIERRGMQGRL